MIMRCSNLEIGKLVYQYILTLYSHFKTDKNVPRIHYQAHSFQYVWRIF